MEKTNTKPEINKPTALSEIFKSRKDVPSFLAKHPIFQPAKDGRKQFKYWKIFPYIGVNNFREECEMKRPMLDLKKENFVTPVVRLLVSQLSRQHKIIRALGDNMQYSSDFAEESSADADAKLEEIYNLTHIIKSVLTQIDVNNGNYERCVQNAGGKIAIKLVGPISDRAGEVVFKEGMNLFKVYTRLSALSEPFKAPLPALETFAEFKTFCAENVTDKKYYVCFSSAGEEGAWDILTMSMRGLRSCQRWDGEYHRCLIGSVASRYVGIMYITSGANVDFTYKDPNGAQPEITARSTKMVRRCLVRYAVDTDERQPCLLIDRIYPTPQQGTELEEETLKIFTEALQAKTKLPVYYAPNLGNKVRHFYIPYEGVRGELPEREWTYQDTPLKTNVDMRLSLINNSCNEDVNRYITAFKSSILTSISENFRSVINKEIKIDDEAEKTIRNIKLNLSTDRFIDGMVKTIFHAYPYMGHSSYTMDDEPRIVYRKYLMGLVANLKRIEKERNQEFVTHITNSTSRQVDNSLFSKYFFSTVIGCIKQEIKRITR